MKTYSTSKLDALHEGDNARTIKTSKKGSRTLYLDALNNGEFAVNIDDINKGVFDNIITALQYFEQLEKSTKN